MHTYIYYIIILYTHYFQNQDLYMSVYICAHGILCYTPIYIRLSVHVCVCVCACMRVCYVNILVVYAHTYTVVTVVYKETLNFKILKVIYV